MAEPDDATDRWLRSNGFPSLATGGARRSGRGIVTTTLLVLAWFVCLAVPSFLGVSAVRNSADWAGATPWVVAGALLAVVLAVLIVGYGIDKMMWFSIRWFIQLLGRSSGRHLHLLPLLLVAVTFFFLGAETWQSVGRLTGLPLFLLSLLFTGLAVVFLVKRGDSDPERLAGFSGREDLRDALPRELRAIADGVSDRASPPIDLRFAQRLNLIIVSLLGRVLVALAVGALITVFFLVFGFLAVDLDTAASWSTQPPTPLVELRLGGHTYALTLENVRVAIFLGVFSSFYFIVSSASDTAMARSLSEDTDEHVRACLAVHEVSRRRHTA